MTNHRTKPAPPVQMCAFCEKKGDEIESHLTPCPPYWLEYEADPDSPEIGLCSGCATITDLLADPNGAAWLGQCLAALLAGVTVEPVSAEDMAKKIAADLFSDGGTGKAADRLRLETGEINTATRGGAWAIEPLAIRIEGHLTGEI